jgi:hypothetical protein
MKYPIASAKNANAKPELVEAAIVPITASTRDNEIKNTLFMVTHSYYIANLFNSVKKSSRFKLFYYTVPC